jgi:hypothetical protein
MKKVRPYIFRLLFIYSLVVFTSLSLNAQSTDSIYLSGTAILSGQTDHSGINVTVTSFVGDTVAVMQTNIAGVYGDSIASGIYSINYRAIAPDSFCVTSITETDVLCTSDKVLDKTLLYGIGGDYTGVLSGSIIVACDLVVPAGDSLELSAGTALQFASGSQLIVNGKLKIQGSETDSVILSAYSSSWDGVQLNSSSMLQAEYIHITGLSSGSTALYLLKTLTSPSPVMELSNSLLSGEGIADYGLKVNSNGASTNPDILLENVIVEGFEQAGTYIYWLEDDEARMNYVHRGGIVRNCGGIFIPESHSSFGTDLYNLTYEDVVFENNTGVSNDYAGLLVVTSTGDAEIKSCVFRNNTPYSNYSSSDEVLDIDESVSFSNCVFETGTSINDEEASSYRRGW